MGKKLTDLKYEGITAETSLAYGFQFEGKDELVWIPKSQCEVDEDTNTVTMSESLAVDKEIEGNAI